MTTLWSILVAIFAPSIAQLGSEDFGKRESASGTLKAAGWLAIPALVKGSQSTDREVSSRCEQLLRRYPPAVDVTILAIVFRSGGWVAGCEVHHLQPWQVNEALRRWGLFKEYPAEPWPMTLAWSEYEQMIACLNFARMRAKSPTLHWAAVSWDRCLEPE